MSSLLRSLFTLSGDVKISNLVKNRVPMFTGMKKDIIVNSFGGCLIFGIGDAIAQLSNPTWHYERTTVLATQGFILNGALLTPLYRILDAIVGETTKPGRFWPGGGGRDVSRLLVLFVRCASKNCATATHLYACFHGHRALRDSSGT